MRIDSLQMRMRSRSPHEAADLGVRLCQHHWRSLHTCHAAVAVPVLALCIAAHEIAGWLPLTLIFLAKPWLDRVSLFVLSRAAFGQKTTLADLWSAQREVLWRQLLLSWTMRRLSPWRAFSQPVYQLEGLGFRQRRRRLGVLRGEYRGPALLTTSAFAIAETMLVIGLVSLAIWLAPSPRETAIVVQGIGNFATFSTLLLPCAYAVVVLFLEPFYVATGFAMYLNRRAELEAWDIEQELRNAFAA
jgi:hypothetical protein